MAEAYRDLNLTVELIGLALCTLAIVYIAVVGPRLEKRTIRYFILYYALLTGYTACNIAGQLLRGQPGSAARAFLYAANFGEFLLGDALIWLAAYYLLSALRPVRGEGTVRRILRATAYVQAAFLVLSQFTGLIYTIGPDNVYRRSAGYPLIMVLPLGILALDFILLFRERGNVGRRERLAILFLAAVPMAAGVAQIFLYGLYLMVFAGLFVGLAAYLGVAVEETERRLRQEQAPASQTVRLMLEQLRPHFLVNTICAIQALYREDADEAEEALRRFTDYLRRVVESVAEEKPVPFARELEHVRDYLYLQRTRFPAAAEPEYDLECVEFLLPSLTLLPMTAGAVRSGLWQGGGTLLLRAREYPDRREVTVEASGCRRRVGLFRRGWEAAVSDDLRDRTRRISGGDIHAAGTDRGSAVVLVLPKQADARTDTPEQNTGNSPDGVSRAVGRPGIQRRQLDGPTERTGERK